MIVEPFALNKLEENMNPVGRIYYAASTLICVPHSLANNGLSLGAQAGEERIKKLVKDSNFTKFRRVMDSPINMVYEIKP